MSLGSLLDDHQWHHVAVEHHSTHLNLTVDKSTLWVQIPPRFTHWDHDQVCLCRCETEKIKNPSCIRTFSCRFSSQMSVGADLSLGSWRSVGSNRNFHGCLENLLYNGVSLVELAKQRDQRVTEKVNEMKTCCVFV